MSAAAGPVISGFLNIDKAPGMTSMDVLRRIKRATGQKKVGHGGTLDPDATGVLPVCLGRATRFIGLVVDGTKQYTMTVRVGAATDTYDASGSVTKRCDASAVTRRDVEAALPAFSGEIDQVPPMYSAIKRQGKRLYELARQGIEVEREPRRVTVGRLDLLDASPPDFMLQVECGRGFYARTLAHDLGRALDNAAHLLNLVRDRAGPFQIEDAISLDGLEERAKLGNWLDQLYPVDFVLEDLPALVVDPLNEERIRQGQPVKGGEPHANDSAARDAGSARVYTREGEFVAVARFDSAGGWWRPERVIPPA